MKTGYDSMPPCNAVLLKPQDGKRVGAGFHLASSTVYRAPRSATSYFGAAEYPAPSE
jgi:hypothetical protein